MYVPVRYDREEVLRRVRVRAQYEANGDVTMELVDHPEARARFKRDGQPMLMVRSIKPFMAVVGRYAEPGEKHVDLELEIFDALGEPMIKSSDLGSEANPVKAQAKL